MDAGNSAENKGYNYPLPRTRLDQFTVPFQLSPVDPGYSQLNRIGLTTRTRTIAASVGRVDRSPETIDWIRGPRL